MRRFAHLVKGISQASWGRHRGGGDETLCPSRKGDFPSLLGRAWGREGAMPCSLFSSLLSRKTRFLYPSETVSSLLFSTFTRSIFQVIIVQGLALLVFFTTFAKKKTDIHKSGPLEAKSTFARRRVRERSGMSLRGKPAQPLLSICPFPLFKRWRGAAPEEGRSGERQHM